MQSRGVSFFKEKILGFALRVIGESPKNTV